MDPTNEPDTSAGNPPKTHAAGRKYKRRKCGKRDRAETANGKTETEKRMLQVRKKKVRGGGRRKALLLLVILLAVGAAGAYLLMREESSPVPHRAETGGAVLETDPGTVIRVTVRVRGRKPWSAERGADGVLRMTEGWALSETRAEQVLDALQNLVYEDILTEDPEEYRDHLEDFGLADPALTAEVTYADGRCLTFHIGDASGLADRDYRFMIVEGDDRLYAVAGSLMTDLETEADVLRGVTQPDIQTSRLDRIRILGRNGESLAEWVLEGSITDQDAPAAWMVRTGKIFYPADQDKMSQLKKNAGNLMLGLYLGEAAEMNLSDYGLDQPLYTIELHMAAGTTGQIVDGTAYEVREGEEETLRFLIGDARNEMTRFVLYEGAVCTMNQFTVSALTDTDPLTTVSRYPFLVPLESLSSMTVEAERHTDTYRLTRVSRPSDTEGEPAGIEMTCERNGETYSYDVFSADYQRAMVVTVSGALPDGWEKQPDTRVYTFRTLGGKTHRVELSPFDALHDALTVDGESLFYLSRNALSGLF